MKNINNKYYHNETLCLEMIMNTLIYLKIFLQESNKLSFITYYWKVVYLLAKGMEKGCKRILFYSL